MSFFNHSRYAIFCFKRFFINEVIGCIFKAAVQKDRNCNSNKNEQRNKPDPSGDIFRYGESNLGHSSQKQKRDYRNNAKKSCYGNFYGRRLSPFQKMICL